VRIDAGGRNEESHNKRRWVVKQNRTKKSNSDVK
jgi:hypothetical protein